MIPVSAELINANGENKITLRSQDVRHSIEIQSRKDGTGIRARGGELLLLALAACYTNDIYREASTLNIEVESVEVKVDGDFAGYPGCVAENVTLRARVAARADNQKILDLIMHTDTFAEISNTLRNSTPISLVSSEAVVIKDDN